MPLAQIDSKGTSIYYNDSGVPHGSSQYTTIVLVHGAVVNSATFERMLPYAPKYGLRMITMNSRDYRRSTPYTAEELADLTSSDVEVQASGVRRWGREIGLFLAYVCKTMDILPVTGEGAKQTGGLVLATWSLSCMAGLSILGDSRTLGGELATMLAPYLHKIILYDPPAIIYGSVPEIVGLTWPFVDPTVPHERKVDAFIDHASSYAFTLPEDVPITAENLLKHYTVLSRTPTLRTLSPEDFERTIDPGVQTRSLLVASTDLGIRQRHARCALSEADTVLPEVEILALWCDQSVWLTAWGAKVFHELVQEVPEAGKKKRRASFVRVKSANHFIHWDEPERMARFFAEHCICSSPDVSSLESDL